MKRITLFLLSICMVPVYGMMPGAFIQKNNLSLQYTVSPLKPESNISMLSLPVTQLCKEKGSPVIISFVCGKAPWWALATSTGYILVAQLDDCTAHLYCSLVNGSSYAIGEALSGMIANKNFNSYVQCALQACMATSCACAHFVCQNDMLKNASLSVLTAVGFNMINIVANMVFENKKNSEAHFAYMTPEQRLQKILADHPLDGYNLIVKPYLVAASIVFGGIALTTPAAFAAAVAYIKNNPLPSQTILTESVYRLTKKVCDWTYTNEQDKNKTTSA